MQNAVLRVKGKGDDIIAKFTKILANSNEEYTRIPQLSTGMVLLSGRRIAELLSGDVRLSEGSTDMSVIFQESSTARPVEIPLLCSFNTFRHGMGVLSKLQGGKRLTRMQVKKKHQTTINYYVEKHFSFTSGDDVVSVNDLRYVYAFMAFKKYNYASLGLTYQEFLSWVSNLTSRMAILSAPASRASLHTARDPRRTARSRPSWLSERLKMRELIVSRRCRGRK